MSGNAETQSDAEHGSHELAHPVSAKLLVGVLVVLLGLTWLTVAATWVDLGELNIVIAMAIAFVKATFVGLFFMHLYWDKPFNGFILVSSLFFVALFLSFCMLDGREYQPEVDRVPLEVEKAITSGREPGSTPAGQ